MVVVHKCDVCKKPIGAERITVDFPTPYNRFEFCKRCGGPVVAFLKHRKLAPKPA